MVPVPHRTVTVRLITKHELGEHARDRCRPFPLAHEKTVTARDVSRVGVWGGLRGLHRPPRRPVSSGARARPGSLHRPRRARQAPLGRGRPVQDRSKVPRPQATYRHGFLSHPCAHPEFSERQRIHRAMCRRRMEPLRRALRGVLIPRR